MERRILDRVAGGTLVLGGLMGALAHFIHPAPPHDAQALHSYIASTVSAHLLLGAAVLLVCLGLPALSARVAGPRAVFAYLAYPLLLLGLMSSEFLHCPVEIAIFPEMESLGYGQATRVVGHIFSGASIYGRVQMIGLPLIIAGVVALLISTRNSELPRWPAVFLVGFLAFLAATFFPIIHGLPAEHLFPINLYMAFAAYGTAMITAAQPAHWSKQGLLRDSGSRYPSKSPSVL